MKARTGIALFAALTLMAIIALLVAGALSTLTLAERASRAGRTDAILTASADLGLATVLSDPDRFRLADIALGQTTSSIISSPDANGVTVVASATRLPAGLLWLVSDARMSGVDEGHRRFNLVVRFPLLGQVPSGPIVSRGDVRVAQDVVFLTDTNTDSECGRSAAAQVVVAPGASVIANGRTSDSVKFVIQETAADSSTYYQLARQIGALDSAGQIVHVRGDTVITGGSFDGVLLVDGSVTISGPFHAAGVIAARGRIMAVTGAFSLTGALLAFAAPGASASVDLAGATVSYSPCKVSRAFRQAIPPKPVRQRGWAELF